MQKIEIGTLLEIRGTHYECIRISRNCECYQAFEGGDYLSPIQSRLPNIKVLASTVDEHTIGDTIEVSYERISFKSVDPSAGPFIVYNYYNIRKVTKDERPSESSPVEAEHAAAAHDIEGPTS